MTISSSLSNALSGLTAAARAAEVVSGNVANALTDGYGRREVTRASRSLGGVGAGVQVTGVLRHVDQVIVNDRRIADAAVGEGATRAVALARIEAAIGLPGEAGSLADRITGFEAALIEVASRPESEPRLAGVLDAARGLAAHLNAVSDEIQTVRMQADAAIANDVAFVNDALGRLEEINAQIRRMQGGARDVNTLIDHRQQIVDSIAPIVPLREVDRGNGQIALFTPGGAILLDGSARPLAFAATGFISPDMTLGSGALSGLEIGGVGVDPGGRAIAGGRLAANFAIRDQAAPAAQAAIDGVARDLMTRLEAADATLAPGAAGLFTDAGAAFDPGAETGLAARLGVNPLADPAAGGALWRLRDGLGAAAPGPTGAAAGLQALSDALSALQVPGSPAFSAVPRSLSGLAAEVLSSLARDRMSAEAQESFAAGRHAALRAQELQGGVDTDHEMQQLLLVEQAYGANAQVLQTIDDMIQTLLRM